MQYGEADMWLAMIVGFIAGIAFWSQIEELIEWRRNKREEQHGE